MPKYAPSLEQFLDFSNVINADTRRKFLNITKEHPALKNHPIIQSLESREPALIKLSQLTEVNEIILKYSVGLAKGADANDTKACLRVIMQQNVLTVASTAFNALMTEQYQNNVDRLSKIIDVRYPFNFDEPDLDEDIDYLRQLEIEMENEALEEF